MSSPYQSPSFSSTIPPLGAAFESTGHPMQPLYSARGWLKFLAWFNIIYGALCAISIVGLIIAWLPIWIGLCLKNASESISSGYPTNNAALASASNSLATVAKIVGVLCIINIAIFALYLVIVLLLVVTAVGTSVMNR